MPSGAAISAETADALNAARAKGGRIVAVGTTSLRLLESAATEDGTIQPFNGETSIFITPGYRFRAVDILLTNFHLPRSTLFMLVSAFSGLDTMKQRLCARDQRGVPVLFLWRCVPAVSWTGVNCRRVGKAKRAHHCELSVEWWARRKSAFAHPTKFDYSPHAMTRCGSNSAIWIAFSAAPFRSWSADTNIEIEWPLGSLRSLRMRPTSTSSWPDASIGIGK